MAVAIWVNNGLKKEVKLGFSWTTFFFGWLVPLFRGDKRSAVSFLIFGFIALILALFTALFALIIYNLIIAWHYNRIYAKFLIENGWKPETEIDRELLVSKGVATSRRY